MSVRPLRNLRAGLAVASLLAVAAVPACGAPPSDSQGAVGQTSEAIVNGTAVPKDYFGSAMLWLCPGGVETCCPNGAASCTDTAIGFKGGCSGTMVADQWMLTASHCVNTTETNGGGGTPVNASGVIAISADRASMATADAIFLNPTYDVALVHFLSSITNAAGVAYTMPIYTGTSASLVGKTIYCQGFGVSDGQDGSPTYGTLRSAFLTVDSAITGWISMNQNAAGQLLSFGDSGTGCFLASPPNSRLHPIFSENALVGVQSLEFPGFDDIVGADGFTSWASCILKGWLWLGFANMCAPLTTSDGGTGPHRCWHVDCNGGSRDAYHPIRSHEAHDPSPRARRRKALANLARPADRPPRGPHHRSRRPPRSPGACRSRGRRGRVEIAAARAGTTHAGTARVRSVGTRAAAPRGPGAA